MIEGFFIFLKKYYPLLTILVVELVLFLTNYPKGTFLIGWDSLYPELNFPVNFNRGIYAIWQEYRGLGLLDGMAHAANLPHTLFLWLLHLILPLNLLRYFFVFLMHFVGGLGTYFLLERILLRDKKENKLVSLLGALFYLFNLVTIQIFYAPLEVFCVSFAFLPWLTFSILKYLETPKSKNLLYFILFSILSLPQGFVPQVFLVYCLLVFFILSFTFLKEKTKAIKKLIVVILVIFTVNSYWGLPYAYSVVKNSKVIVNAKINQMSSDNIYLNNRFRGDFKNVVTLKGFMLDVTERIENGKFAYIMETWRKHQDKKVFKTVSLVFFLTTLLGTISAYFKRKQVFLPFLATFFLSFFFLGTDVWGLSFLNHLLREKVPVLGEAFRFSFTKFSLIYVFCYTIFFSFGLVLLSSFLEKILKKKIFIKGLLAIFFLSVVFYSFPAFRGNFIFNSLKLRIPPDYFQTMNFFNQHNKYSRIANFPQPSIWSWRYLRWGYRGSGFLWQGIGQPILDRAFNPWSDKNENFYWEISYALYSQNQELFEKVLEKYQINWLLIDGNVINPSSPKALYLDELEEMIDASDKIILSQQFGKIKIYQVQLETPIKDFVCLAKNLPQIEPAYIWTNYDLAYLENSTYFSSLDAKPYPLNAGVYYPFRSLFTGRNQGELEFEIEENENNFLFKQTIPEQFRNYQLLAPEEENKELVWIKPNDFSQVLYFEPEVNFENSTIEVKIPKIGGHYGADIKTVSDPSIQTPENCDLFSQGEVKNEIVEEGNKKLLRVSATDAKNCSLAFWLPDLSHKLSYLITVESRYITGKSLLFWIENLNARKADIETYLPKKETINTSLFIQPPMESDGLGYSLHFDNISIGRVESVNDLGRITVNPIPFKFLTELKLVSNPKVKSEVTLFSPLEVSHPNPSYYKVALNNSKINQFDNLTLVLSQAYHSGWIAWEGRPFFGKKLDHVLVNNWQNGWILDNNQPPITDHQSQITIFFWPQLLEYFGFILLFGLLGYSAYKAKKGERVILQNPKHLHPQVLHSS